MNVLMSVGAKDATIVIPIDLGLWGFVMAYVMQILGYLVIRYSVMKGEISLRQFGISASIGFVLFVSMIVPLVTGKMKNIK